MKHEPAQHIDELFAPRFYWPHTGILAPAIFRYTNLQQFRTEAGVAYRADICHQRLGVIGHVENAGDGGETIFVSADSANGDYDLTRVAQLCHQDLQRNDGAMDRLEYGAATLADAIVEEQDIAMLVDDGRRSGGTLVREVAPGNLDGRGPLRRAPFMVDSVLLSYSERRDLQATLDTDPRTQRAFEASVWQMHSGRFWRPLIPPESSKRPSLDLDSRDQWRLPSRQSWGIHVDEDEPFCRFRLGNLSVVQQIATADSRPACVGEWCRCPRNSQLHLTYFEVLRRGLLDGRGFLHGDERCRKVATLF